MTGKISMERRCSMLILCLLLAAGFGSTKKTAAYPDTTAPPRPAVEEKHDGVNFSRTPCDNYTQRIVERVTNREHYKGRPDPRAKKTSALSEEEKKRVEKLIPKLGDESWEVRVEANEELKKFCPAAVPILRKNMRTEPDVEIRQRLAVTIKNAHYELYQKEPEELVGTGRNLWYSRIPENCPDPEYYFRTPFYMYWIAAQKRPGLANDTRIRSDFQSLYSEKWATLDSLDDTALYMLVKYDELVKRFPDSPFIEDALFRLGEYEELDRRYPNGRYSSYVMYSRIAGHWYFKINPGGVKIRDRKREIEMWPKFLREYPDHPGANDAWYRYGRALEEDGRYIEAIRALAKARDCDDGVRDDLPRWDRWPDDTENIRQHARDRIRYIMDSLMSVEQLDKIKDEFARDEEIYPECLYAYAMRCLRAGRFEEAREFFAAIIEWRHWQWRNSRKVVGSEATKDLLKYTEDRIDRLDNNILPCWRAYQKNPTATGAAEHLFKIGETFYGDKFCLYNRRHDTRLYLTHWGHTVRRRKEYYLECNTCVAAARFYFAILQTHSESVLRRQARKRLADCFRRLADDYFFRFEDEKTNRYEYEQIARELLNQVNSGYPDGEIPVVPGNSRKEQNKHPP